MKKKKLKKTLEQRKLEIDTIKKQLDELGLVIEEVDKEMELFIKEGNSYTLRKRLPDLNRNLVLILTNHINKVCQLQLLRC